MTGGMEKQSYELITRVQKTPGIQVIVLIYNGQEPKWLWFAKLKTRVKKILDEHSIDLIHFNDGLVATYCYWIKQFTKVPVTATFHGLDITFPSRLFQRFGIKVLRNIDLGICVSDATREACVSRGFNHTKLCTVANGVDHHIPKQLMNREELTDLLLKEYQVDISGKKIIISIGRAVKRKGFSWFATKVAPHLYGNIIWLHVGPYATNSTLTQMLPQSLRTKLELFSGGLSDSEDLIQGVNKLSGNGYMLGKVSQPLLNSLLHHAQLFIMPNIPVHGDAEGFGLVALEASITSTWVIAADLEGIPGAIHKGKNGMLLPTLQDGLWVKTINELIRNQASLEQLSQKGQAYTLETFSWDTMASEYVAKFQSLITRKVAVGQHESQNIAL